MTTSVVKWLVVLGAVVAGVIVLAKAFESAVQPTGPTVAISPSTEPKPGRSPKADKSPSADAAGVLVGIYNGTDQTDLAKKVEKQVKSNEGYVIDALGNTSKPQLKTTVYYVKGKDADAAQSLADADFPDAFVLQLPSDAEVDVDGVTGPVGKGVQVAIFIGADYKP